MLLSTLQRALALLALATFVLGSVSVSAAPTVPHGQVTALKGFDGHILISRDGNGIPSIRARSADDAQLGLGYVHAQDRLWQMEWQRRLANGRAAELIGEPGIKTDVLFRTLGLRRVAEATWEALGPKDRRPFEAYVAGVNRYLAALPADQLPLEFTFTGSEPEPWTPVDVLVFSKLFTWGNGSNWDKELLRAQLAQALGPERAVQLMPAYLADGPRILPGGAPGAGPGLAAPTIDGGAAVIAELLALHEQVASQTGIGADGRGSNAWVLSGKRTTNGKPILANDPHLSSSAPAIWYLARLNFGAEQVSGATIPGAPGVQIGRNRRIAWGVSTINVDSQDLYVEQVNDRNEALFQGAWEPMQVVQEVIKVRGEPNLVLNVRSTRHGPLLSDAVNPAGPAIAVRWTGGDPVDNALQLSLAINKARNWQEFTEAFRTYRAAQMNYVYADRAGNIGYFAGATIPIRPRGDGSLPLQGWTGEDEWVGYVPWEQLPQRFNPPEGYIVAANNLVADGLPYSIGNSFAAPYRAARIVELVEAKERHSAESVAAMQGDVLADHAHRLMPLLLRTNPTDERGRQALELLRGWDLRASGDSVAASVFESWYMHLAPNLFADELGPLWPSYSRQLYAVGMAMEVALLEDQAWCDDATTKATESCADTLAAALADGLADMAVAQNTNDMAAWRWDNVHTAYFPHQPFGSDGMLGAPFNRSIPNGGDRFTVNVGSSFRDWEDYAQFHAGQYRQIITFGDARGDRWIIAPGQDGDPNKPNYDNLLERWRDVEYLPMR
jgi:penicillin amidase